MGTSVCNNVISLNSVLDVFDVLDGYVMSFNSVLSIFDVLDGYLCM